MDRQKSKERKEMQRDDRKKNGPIEVERGRWREMRVSSSCIFL